MAMERRKRSRVDYAAMDGGVLQCPSASFLFCQPMWQTWHGKILLEWDRESNGSRKTLVEDGEALTRRFGARARAEHSLKCRAGADRSAGGDAGASSWVPYLHTRDFARSCRVCFCFQNSEG